MVTHLVEDVHGRRVRDDRSLVVELENGLAPHVHHQRVNARHVVRHARVRSLGVPDRNTPKGGTAVAGVGVNDVYYMHAQGGSGENWRWVACCCCSC